MSRHFDDLDAVLEFDPSNDFRQLVFSFQLPPGENHQVGGRCGQRSLELDASVETQASLSAEQGERDPECLVAATIEYRFKLQTHAIALAPYNSAIISDMTEGKVKFLRNGTGIWQQ